MLSHTHMYTQARTWRDHLCCHTHTCTHRRGPGGTACAVTNTHVHTGEDLEGLPVLHIHVYAQVKTGRDHLCCHTQTCTHGGGCRVLSHTVLCVMKHFTLT